MSEDQKRISELEQCLRDFLYWLSMGPLDAAAMFGPDGPNPDEEVKMVAIRANELLGKTKETS